MPSLNIHNKLYLLLLIVLTNRFSLYEQHEQGTHIVHNYMPTAIELNCS